MGSITGRNIDYNGAGAPRGQRHIPSKTEPKYPTGTVSVAGRQVITGVVDEMILMFGKIAAVGSRK